MERIKGLFRRDKEFGGEEHGISSDGQGLRKRFKTTDDETTRNTLIRAGQIFFLSISLFIQIAIAVFQKREKVGPSALSVLNFVIIIQCLLHSIFLLVIPLLHDRVGSFKGLLRSIQQVRFGFVVAVTQSVLLLLFALINTISANVKGCKNAEDDPHADDEEYIEKLPGFCRNKRALTAFFYFALFSWLVSLYFVFQQWREYRKGGGGAIPPFREPSGTGEEGDAFDERSHPHYDAPEMQYAAPGRVSGTFIGSDRPFEEPPPSGYGYVSSPTGGYAASPTAGNPFSDPSPPYADPYDRIRAELDMRDQRR